MTELLSRREALRRFSTITSFAALQVATGQQSNKAKPDSGSSPIDDRKSSMHFIPSLPQLKQDTYQMVLDSEEGKRNPREVDPQTHKKLKEILLGLLKEVPSAIPEATIMPREARFYIYDDSRIGASTKSKISVDRKFGAMTFMFSDSALKQLSSGELRFALAHEVGHVILLFNPGINFLSKYHSQTKEAQEERQQRKMSGNEVDKHEEELLSDNIGLRLTKDINSYVSFFVKADESKRQFKENILRHNKEEMKGFPEGTTITTTFKEDYHPRTPLRINEGALLMLELGKSIRSKHGVTRKDATSLKPLP